MGVTKKAKAKKEQSVKKKKKKIIYSCQLKNRFGVF